MSEPLVIVFPIYQGVTQLDFTGPLQFLRRMPGAEIIVASIGGADIASEGLHFTQLQRLEEVNRCDVLCVPGGSGCAQALEDAGFMCQIRRLGQQARYLTSVCTGSLILAAAGLLQGKRATCHWSMRDSLALFGAIPSSARVERDGNVISGGGVTAGIDFALALIAELHDEETAQMIQLYLEYAPAPPFAGGTPELTPPHILAKVQAQMADSLRLRREQVAQIAAQP
ncbi:DJ-1/PfpI family protein [Serratia entomophila]|uniref:DJ-1/PfpI family protein n=1 Tax=Serratia entomophila TaxID=42906 RepID=UPI00217C9445|nr:DJ-1/PfpI family protein [Serratia entomophila]CAI1767259.1 transcriptional activator FtrA [Serratia entomophila]